MSALACYVAAAAIWIGELQTALLLVEESLALTRAGALDPILGFALSLAGAIRARNDDLPGALAVLQEATVQLAGEGNRLGLGMTLERAAAVLVRLGEFEPAAVLAGADSARFALSVAAIYPDEQLGIDEAQVTARRALGEAAYSSAAGRGAAMNETRSPITRSVSSGGSPPRSGNQARRLRNHRQAWRGAAAGNDRLTGQDDAWQESWRGHAPRSFQQARTWHRPAAGQAAGCRPGSG